MQLAKTNTKELLNKLFVKRLDDVIRIEELNVVLSTPPPQSWVKKHPFISGYNYLPIDKVEYLLRSIFKSYRIEVLKTAQLFNTIEVTVRVHYLNPATGQMDFHDGVGAQDLQTQKDSGNLKLDLSNINRGAVTMALPIAKSMAIKDACDHFGEIFGCNLNRKDTMLYEGNATLLSGSLKKEEERLLSFVDKANTKDELEMLESDATLTEKTQEAYQTKLIHLTEKKK